MKRKILKNKPLVEAIFEIRWKLLKELRTGLKVDPNYKLLIGRIYDKVKEEYPCYEQLPTASMPDEIAGYIVQHRFRKDEDNWPLIQIGPGIITLNDTEGYTWEDFERRIRHLVDILQEVYPDSQNNLKITQLILRYIDAVDFDYQNEDIFRFLKEKLKVYVQIDKRLFSNTGVNRLPHNFDLSFSFSSTEPKGAILLRFLRGKRKDKDALMWETIVQSNDDDISFNREKIISWVSKAHILTDDWFFKMIEGELLGRLE